MKCVICKGKGFTLNSIGYSLKICETCLIDIIESPAKVIEKLIDERKELEKEIGFREDKIAELEDEITELEKEIGRLENEIAKLGERINELENK